MSKSWLRKKVGFVMGKSETVDDKKSISGYRLLMDIVDRNVFEVEYSGVSLSEFEELCLWLKHEYNQSDVSRVGGKVIHRDPLILAEVVEDEPVFVEITDYKVRYRVNIYVETSNVDIKVLDAVKDKKLVYSEVKQPVLTL